jgi:hypothetical protein
MKLVYKFVWSSGREKEAAYRGIFVKQESPCFKQNSFLYKKSAIIIATLHKMAANPRVSPSSDRVSGAFTKLRALTESWSATG